jgi:DNA processing protein
MKDKIAWMVLSENLKQQKKLKELKNKFATAKKSVNFDGEKARSYFADVEKAKKSGAIVITYIDEEYPQCLREISTPPPYLYVKGNVKMLNYPLKATIVGSRRATAYGLNVATNFAHELSSNNICVVTGGAKGIDTAALKGAMRGETPVICVIGTGIDINYPKENKNLFEKAAQNGAVISEFPPGTDAFAQNFPRRNRIMTALGDSVVVVEAAEKSGALISANYAAEQGKTLFAVPGNIDSQTSVGTNLLLRDGALFAMSGSDIIYEMMDRLPDSFRKARECNEEKEEEVADFEEKESAQEKNNSSALESAVINAIKNGFSTYEEILEYCACDAKRLTPTLTLMQIKGEIKQKNGNKFELDK